ncbi:MAG TPA: reverse transcriptase domain-containing protein [Candidatus Nanoarchaeia archaeon]|nr:reverse transcriptase domain-containing protein [Candidatus Nanoarchaeia archaeon]
MDNEIDIFSQIISYDNLYLAYEKARKRKTLKQYVIDFEKDLKQNLLDLQSEIIFHTYKPRPLQTFILRDPKTRKISKSDFRDRVIHHAICNIIEPIFDNSFIFDNYANRARKGAFKAVQRFDFFKRKVSKNYTRDCYVLKADIKHYFETVNHEILITLIKKKVNDSRLIWLIKTILANHSGGGRRQKLGCL